MANLAELNKTLATQHYVAGGYAPSAADFTTFGQVSGDLSKFPHVARWQRHIAAFDESEKAAFGSSSSSSSAAPPVSSDAGKKAADDDDDVDIFGSDDEEDEEAERLLKEKAEAAAKAKAEKEKAQAHAPKIIEKSVVIIDVKPWSSEQDLATLEAKIRAITIEGLEWKAAEQKDIGFGIKKLVVSCHIIDALVSVDDIQDAIQNFEDDVQSTDIAAFSKL